MPAFLAKSRLPSAQAAIAAGRITRRKDAPPVDFSFDPLEVLVRVLATAGDDKLIPHIVWNNLQPMLETPSTISSRFGQVGESSRHHRHAEDVARTYSIGCWPSGSGSQEADGHIANDAHRKATAIEPRTEPGATCRSPSRRENSIGRNPRAAVSTS